MTHKQLLSEAKVAIGRVANDLTVSPAEAIDSLGDLKEEISIRVSALKSDLRKEDRDGGRP